MGEVLSGGGIRNIKAVCPKASCRAWQTRALRDRISAPVRSQFRLLSNPESEEYKDGLKSCLSSPKAVNSVLLLHMQCRISPVALLHCLLNLSGSFLHQNWFSTLKKPVQIGMLFLYCKQAQESGTGISLHLF